MPNVSTFSTRAICANMFTTIIGPIWRNNTVFNFVYVPNYIVVGYLEVSASTFRAFFVGHITSLFLRFGLTLNDYPVLSNDYSHNGNHAAGLYDKCPDKEITSFPETRRNAFGFDTGKESVFFV